MMLRITKKEAEIMLKYYKGEELEVVEVNILANTIRDLQREVEDEKKLINTV